MDKIRQNLHNPIKIDKIVNKICLNNKLNKMINNYKTTVRSQSPLNGKIKTMKLIQKSLRLHVLCLGETLLNVLTVMCTIQKTKSKFMSIDVKVLREILQVLSQMTLILNYSVVITVLKNITVLILNLITFIVLKVIRRITKKIILIIIVQIKKYHLLILCPRVVLCIKILTMTMNKIVST